MSRQCVVPMTEAEATIRSAIRVHARKAKHKDADVQKGCETCVLLLAINSNLFREAMWVEVEQP